MKTVDLHLHTTRSDGRFDAHTIIGKISAANVGIAAITDHDTLFGARDAKLEAAGTNIRIVPGTEISTSFFTGGHFIEEVHVLWYGMDVEARDVLLFESEIRDAQNARISKMVSRLMDLGFSLDFDEMVKASNPAPVCLVPIVLQLIARGYVKLDVDSIRGFIDSNLAPGGKVYEPPQIETRQAMEKAKSLGGLTVVAHPAKVNSQIALEAMLSMADGIEALYAAHSAVEREMYLKLCESKGLLATCGSDFHGYYETFYAPPVLTDVQYDSVEKFLERVCYG